MAELRWVLLALGILLVVGVYLWGRGSRRRADASRLGRRRWRAEPRISSDEETVSRDVLFTRPGEEDLVRLVGAGEAETPTAERSPRAETERLRDAVDEGEPGDAPYVGDRASRAEPPAEAAPERIVALRFVPKEPPLDAVRAVEALRDAGLEHGRYGIFHYPDQAYPREPRFSVASLTEPGSFDLERLAEKPLAGMSFFMVLPGVGDPVDRFDAMVQTARDLAYRLDAELFDDRGSSWSIQRERYIREELISYRLQSSPS